MAWITGDPELNWASKLENFVRFSKIVTKGRDDGSECVMTIEWLFAAVLFCAFAFLTLAFRRPEGRVLRTRGPSQVIRWDAPTGH